jgi:hypothetical protein
MVPLSLKNILHICPIISSICTIEGVVSGRYWKCINRIDLNFKHYQTKQHATKHILKQMGEVELVNRSEVNKYSHADGNDLYFYGSFCSG